MKKLIIFLISLLFLTACGSPGSTIVDDTADIETGQITKSKFLDSNKVDLDEGDREDGHWMGTWLRTSVVSGDFSSNEPATLTLNEDTYSSASAACTTSGELKAGDGNITLTMLQSNCPGNVQLPFTVNYTYTIEKNDEEVDVMTTVTGPVVETYIRQ
jgi:hypothetical protein